MTQIRIEWSLSALYTVPLAFSISQTTMPQNAFLNAIKSFHDRHERLKKVVHEGFRYPLPPWGRFLAGCFYFSLPIVGGYHVMQWAISKAHDSIGENGERLPVKEIQGIGNKRVDRESGELKTVGAGGWGGGVRLATSDEETQRKNREKLHKFLKIQKKKLEKNDE